MSYTYLLHLDEPLTYGPRRRVRHCLGIGASVRNAVSPRMVTSESSPLTRAAVRKRGSVGKYKVVKVWKDLGAEAVARLRRRGLSRVCAVCREERKRQRQDEQLPELLARRIEMALQRRVWRAAGERPAAERC